MTEQKELILYQLANLIDAMCRDCQESKLGYIIPKKLLDSAASLVAKDLDKNI